MANKRNQSFVVKGDDIYQLADAAFLRKLAQNDYMINQHLLPDGRRLNVIANRIERRIFG